jgi:hypothetical protein
MLVFIPIHAQRRRYRLVLEEILFGVVFKYWNCVEEEISLFSCPKSGHIRWQILPNLSSLQQLNVVQRIIRGYRNKVLSHKKHDRARSRAVLSDIK